MWTPTYVWSLYLILVLIRYRSIVNNRADYTASKLQYEYGPKYHLKLEGVKSYLEESLPPKYYLLEIFSQCDWLDSFINHPRPFLIFNIILEER